ncbi:UNVERIFIED_CONTAM: hypothetical protein Sradi_2041800 [Sesamum radiatum]|uniref:Reverse transcriptase domain-containing protein n=1 Tax=Sesamum radiatum TaxID=300843 RepID=A0AAW2THJ4_SESRA
MKLHGLLKRLRAELRKWNKNSFGWCHTNIETIKRKIGTLQDAEQSNEVLVLEDNLQIELDEQLKRMEIKWRQKAKQKWLPEGDANTKYFHLTAILQSKSNFIHSIRAREGYTVTEWDLIGCAVEYMSNTISNSVNEELALIPSPDEIKDTVFAMAAFKSPRPDDFPSSLFKQYWHIVGEKVVEAVTFFFSFGILPPAINHTYITLIPKNQTAHLVEQFRSISLCNTIYKVISKIIANKIHPHLEKIISPFQIAFVPGRNINENSIISQEIMHYLHNKKGKKRYMAIKIDLSKAYDHVEWPFLLGLLKAVGFCEIVVQWISQCIHTASFSILINRKAFDYFRPSRGIRQGDPPSPYLFIIYAQFLSRRLLHEESLGNLKGIKVRGASWVWPDIVKSARTLQLGICLPVSMRSALKIWEDPWIPSIDSYKPTKPPNPNPNWPLMVKDLIDRSGNMWKLDLITKMFPGAIVNEIRKIQIPDLLEPINPFWAPSKSGKFSTKAVFSFENAHHIFLKCPFIERILMRSKWQVRLTAWSHLSLREWFMEIFKSNSKDFPDCNTQQEFLSSWAITLEHIWRIRNEKIHGKEIQDLESIAKIIHNNTADHYAVHVSQKFKVLTNEEWAPPPLGWIKVNTDIALKNDKCFAAVIARDHNTFVIRSAATEIFVYSASLAELRAIRIAAELLHRIEADQVIFESDSLEAVKWIKGNVEMADIAALTDVRKVKKI